MFLKRKRAQASAAIIVLVLAAMILVIIAFVFVLFQQKEEILKKDYGYEESKESNEKDYNKESSVKTYEIICPASYIKFGNICCLDSNYNNICDKDEDAKKQEAYSCNYPYARIGSSCCLDDNRNRICDREERDFRKRIRSIDIDSPLDLNSVEVYRNELSFDIENEGNEDVIIKKVKIDDCDTENTDKTIEKGKEKSFSLDCDFGYGKFDSDIEIEYNLYGKNETLTADGRIKGEILRYSDYRDECIKDYNSDRYDYNY